MLAMTVKPIVADASLVARCGLYCGACGSYLRGRCPGCAGNDRATWCKVRTCCRDHGWASCAECSEHSEPKSCGKFDNFISRIFGFIFRSDRAACIAQIRKHDLARHAELMAERKAPSIRRGEPPAA
jgi:hypothetical protein